MNPLQSFEKKLMTGARAVATGVGNIASAGKRKIGMAAKMVTPKLPTPYKNPDNPNRGFNAYKDRLDEALKY